MPRLPSSQSPYGRYKPPEAPPENRPPSGPVDRSELAELLTPKSVVSLAVWLMMFGLGAGLAGLILFVVYQGQVNSLRSELLESQEELRRSLEERIQQNRGASEDASMEVSGTASEADSLEEILESVGPAIVGVLGRDSAGSSASGSGFSVNSTRQESWVLTSHRLVAGVGELTQVSVRYRTSQLVSDLYETDPGRDLAIVVRRAPTDRSLRFSRTEQAEEGAEVWAVGSLRASPFVTGRAVSLTSVTPTSLRFDDEVPAEFIGGPLLDGDGRVLGVITTQVSATPIRLACQRVLRCPSAGPADDAAPEGESDSPEQPGDDSEGGGGADDEGAQDGDAAPPAGPEPDAIATEPPIG